jgi:hypothetical protein
MTGFGGAEGYGWRIRRREPRWEVETWICMRGLLATLTATVLFTTPALATPPGEIATVFFVSKSQNRNEVHYALKVDEECRPSSSAPVRAYWLMREKGPGVVEPLLDKERRAYGIERQRVDGSTVRVALSALPAREIAVQTWRSPEGACVSAATTAISGSRARLFNIHVIIDALGTGIESILLTGWKDDGTVVRERIKR